MNLSPHISLDEFVATAHRGVDNTLPAALYEVAQHTAEMLERIRQFLGDLSGRDVPIILTSGYRCPDLNAAIGSAPTSDHIKAMAADWHAPTFGNPYYVATTLAPHVDELGIGQLIYEFDSWVHTSTRTPQLAVNRIITIDNKGTRVGVQQ